MVGETRTLKVRLLLAAALTVTTTLSLPAATVLGTGTTMLVALHDVGVALTPPMVRVLVPCVAPKFTPFNVTTVPSGPKMGVID